eukprot:3261194-Ditylum_brightwellii.AAC.1
MGKEKLWIFKKYPKRGYVINPTSLQFDLNYQKADLKLDFGTQCSYFEEELDPRFQEPLLEESDLHFFCNTDHGHIKVTRRLITGIMSVVGSTPVTKGLKAAAIHLDINIWSRVHCLEEDSRGNIHTLIPHEVNGDNDE